jgi:tetratricopeptide (TPR) repeat protein
VIFLQKVNVESLPRGHPYRSYHFGLLGSYFQRRFDLLGRTTDLVEAIKNKQIAVVISPDNHTDKPNHLNDLVTAFQARFLRFGNVADIDRAILLENMAVNLAPDSHPLRALLLTNLGNSLQRRHNRFGDLADTQRAIVYQTTAVNSTPDTHFEKHRYLVNLARTLDERFRLLGNIVDLDNAIEHYRAAVNLIVETHPDQPRCQNNLGNSLRARFERLGYIADIKEAISHGEAAVNLTLDGHPDKPMFLNNLGLSLLSCSQAPGSSQDLTDINKAITKLQDAVNLIPNDLSLRPEYLANLGTSLVVRFQRFKNIEDSIRAIKALRKAVNLTPDNHASKLRYRDLHGNALEALFEYQGDLHGLKNVIAQQREIVATTPEELPIKVNYSTSLGRKLLKLFQHNQDLSCAEASLSAFRSAAKSQFGSANARFTAMEKWIAIASRIDHSSLLEAYECLISIIPLVAWLGFPISQRHQYLVRIGGATQEAAATAIAHERYDKAIEWWEQGRSVVWSQILQFRNPVDQLRGVDPNLANEFEETSRLLESGLEGIAFSSEEKARRYRGLATKWETLEKKIQSMPNFEDFLKIPSISKLKNAAQNGPVVVVNIAKKRCDGLVLLPNSDLIHIPLPDITYTKLEEVRGEFHGSLSSCNLRKQDARAAKKFEEVDIETSCKNVLKDLWNDLVKPVITSLKFTVSLFCFTQKPINVVPFSLTHISSLGFGGVPLDHLLSFLYTQQVYMIPIQSMKKLAIMSYPLTHLPYRRY